MARARPHPAALTAGLALTLVACAEPNLHVQVLLPEGLSRDGLSVSLSIFAPAADSGVTCETIAFGDVTLAELRAARIARQVLLEPGASTDLAAGSVRVPRGGTKLLLALAAREYGGLEPELGEAEAAGCRAIETIDGDVVLELPLQWTATPLLEDPGLYLVAELDGAGRGEVASQMVDADEVVRTEPGLRVRLQRADGAATDSDLRLALGGGSQAAQQQVVASRAGLASAGFVVERGGLFEVALRARYQRGPDLPALRGLAYQVVVDSAHRPELAQALDGCRGLEPVPIGLPGQVAGFGCIRPTAADQVELVLIGIGPGAPAPAIEVQRVAIDAADAQLVGAGVAVNGVALYALNVMPGGLANAHLQLWRADGEQALDQELPGPPRLVAVSTIALTGQCSEALELPGFVVGLRALQDPIGNLVGWQLYSATPWRLLGQHALTEGLSLSRLRPSLCLDDPLGQRLRLFPMRGGYPLPPLTMFALGEELVAGQLQALRNLPGLLENTRLIQVDEPTAQGARARILAWFKLGGMVEIDLHALGQSGDRCLGQLDAGAVDAEVACLDDFTFLRTALRLPDLPPVVVGELVSGQLLEPAAGGWPDVLGALTRGTTFGAFYTELYLFNLGGGAHGRLAVDACRDAMGCGMRAADLDGDGVDELLAALGRDPQGALQARVVRFRTAP